VKIELKILSGPCMTKVESLCFFAKIFHAISLNKKLMDASGQVNKAVIAHPRYL